MSAIHARIVAAVVSGGRLARSAALALLTLTLALTFTATPAAADEGELFVDLTLVPELAAASHPDAGVSSFAPPTSNASVLFPAGRAGLGARYGLTNAIHLGLGVDAALGAGLVGHDVAKGGFKGDLVTGTRLALTTPLSAGWRIDSGEDVSAVLELSAGPTAVLWAGSALVSPDTLDDAGLPSRLPPDIKDRWELGARFEARALFEVRLFDVVTAAIGPEVTLCWADTTAASVGLVLRPSLVVPLPL